MHFEYAITRVPGENFAEGLTSAALGPADLALMRAQHRAYVEALRDAGPKACSTARRPSGVWA